MKILLAAIALLTLVCSDALAFGRVDGMIPRIPLVHSTKPACATKTGVEVYIWRDAKPLENVPLERKLESVTYPEPAAVIWKRKHRRIVFS